MRSKDSEPKTVKKVRTNHVLIGLSGGNGSALAAALLKSQGYDVSGVHFILGTPSGPSYPSACAREGMKEQAQRRADLLGIECYVLDLREQFDYEVADYSVHSYLQRRVPYPCIPCNGTVKLQNLYNEAQKKGYRWIATGHYAQVDRSDNDDFQVKMALASDLDQSFELFTVTPTVFKSLLTPLGNLPLSKLEKLAIQLGFIQAGEDFELDRPHPCFARQPGYVKFINERAGAALRPAGVIRTVDGRVLGEHQGLHQYELGQVGMFGRDKKSMERLAVVGYDEPTPGLVVGDEQYLLMREFLLSKTHWLRKPKDELKGFRAQMRAHPQGKLVDCQITLYENGAVRVTFDDMVRVIPAGSPIAIYDENELLGGGWLERGEKLPST